MKLLTVRCRECEAMAGVLETRQREHEIVSRRYECVGPIQHRFTTLELPAELVAWNSSRLKHVIEQLARGRARRRNAARKRQIVAGALKRGEKVDNIKAELKTDGRLIASVRRAMALRYGPDPSAWPA